MLSSASSSTRSLPQLAQPQPSPLAARRPFSSDRIDEFSGDAKESTKAPVGKSSQRPVEPATEPLAEGSTKHATPEEDEEPWFLQEAPPRHPPSQHKPTLPIVPSDAPALLEPMLKYVYEDMGLDDLSILDLRDLDPQASLGPNLIMLFGTARSERHLHISSGRFIRWLKRNHNVSAKGEGLIGAGELKTKLRRLRKKAKLMGQSMTLVPGADNGISTGWVCVNFRTTEDNTIESASFDEGGRMTGFGSSETGTTIVVQCMTESRRTELNLEKLWKDIFRRNLKEQARIRDEAPSDEELNQILSSKLQLHEASGTSQFEAMERASQQHRYFSTSARRLQSLERSDNPTPIPTPPRYSLPPRPQQPQVYAPDAENVRAEFLDVQVNGASMDFQKLQSLVADIFRAPLQAGFSSSDRLRLVDQLLQTGDERGLKVRSRAMLVTLIESIVVSPAYAQDLGRAQRNFELLLRELDECPAQEEVVRLMEAYWVRGDWGRFWDTLSTPTRFNQPRSYEVYELAFRAAAGRNNKSMATEMVRRLWPEMHRENPPVTVVGPLVDSIKACISAADHKAAYRHANPLGARKLRTAPYLRRRKHKGSEMLRVLRELREAEELATTPRVDSETGKAVAKTLPQLQSERFQLWAEHNLTRGKPKNPKQNKEEKQASIRYHRYCRQLRRVRGARRAKAVYLKRKNARYETERREMEEEEKNGGVAAQLKQGRRHHE